MAGPERNLLLIVWQNFVKSLMPRQIRGNKMGKDYLGNAYFEIPAAARANHRKPSRWYTPPAGSDFEAALPSEWDSWLRHRRSEPPTEEEVASNVALAKQKRENAARLEAERLAVGAPAGGGSLPAVGGSLPAPVSAPDGAPRLNSYPKYDDYSYGGRPKE